MSMNTLPEQELPALFSYLNDIFLAMAVGFDTSRI